MFAETFIPCLVGAIVGTAAAPLLAAVPRRLLPPGAGGDPEPSLWIAAVAWAVVCAALIAITGSAIPLLRLARLNVADALARRTHAGSTSRSFESAEHRARFARHSGL